MQLLEALHTPPSQVRQRLPTVLIVSGGYPVLAPVGVGGALRDIYCEDCRRLLVRNFPARARRILIECGACGAARSSD